MAVTSASTTFDEMFATTSAPSVEGMEPERRHWFASWEEWLTLSLVLLVQIPVIGSLQSANWVDEMPSLFSAGVLGVFAGWLMAHSRLRAGYAIVGGIAVAATIVIGMVLHTMERVDLELGEGLRGAWSEFWLRLRDWGAAFIDGGISTDPLPFVVLMVTLVFAVAYLASWSVVRWRNPWVALVPGGVVLLTNISYLPGQPSIAFVIFLLAAVLLVTRLQYLKSATRWQTARVNAPLGMSGEVLGAGVLIALILILFAWTVPTANNWGPVSDAWMRVTAPVRAQVDNVGQLFIGVRSRQPLPVHAFGATLPLQGSVNLRPDTLFEVVTEEPGLLRGAVYDEYTGNGWRLSSSDSVPLGGDGVAAARLGTVETRLMLRQAVVTEITVVGELAPGSMLLTPGDPLAASVEGDFVLGPTSEPFGIAPAQSADVGTEYTTVGAVSAAAIDTLRGAGTGYPATIYGTYTALPDDLPQEIHTLAQTIVGDAPTPYDAALRIESYLRSNYTFTLDAPRPTPRQDAVATFLFEDATGHFDHFASAMAVMLRTVGIPSRVSVGFVLDSSRLDSETGAFRISERDAWAWPEVYFPGYGWVEFNPAPARGVFQRPGDDAAAQRDREAAGELDLFFDPLFEEFYLEQLAMEDDLMGGGAFDPLEPDAGASESAGGLIVRILSFIVLASAVLFAALLAIQFLWERRFRGLPPATRRWGKVQRLAHWAGIAPESHRTSVEGAQDMTLALGSSLAPALQSLARAYTRERYGPHDAEATESEATAREQSRYYRAIRGQLWRLVLRRIVRFGRVPDESLPGRRSVLRSRSG